jgi:AAA family ATP:ADP antiporter
MKSATAAKGILASTTKKNPLREIFDIRREELPIVTLLFLFFFLVIAVFQILRPLKKGLFVEYYGADLELYAKLSNILVAAVGVAVFTYLYKKLPRQRLLYVFCGFFIVCFVALGFALTGAEPLPIWGFYVLGDLLSTLMVAAFFAFLTDVATPDQAKRLFGVIGGGGVVGGWAGSTLARTLLNTIRTQGLLFLSAALMGMIILVIPIRCGSDVGSCCCACSSSLIKVNPDSIPSLMELAHRSPWFN